MKKYYMRLTAVAVILCMLFLGGCESGSVKKNEKKTDVVYQPHSYPFGELTGEPADYSDDSNWYQIPDRRHEVDCIFLYPSCYTDTAVDAPDIVPSIDDPTMRTGVETAYDRFAAAFEDTTDIYVPYYRQINTASLTDAVGKSDMEEIGYGLPRTDVYAALDYFFEHYNIGRPFILAGHGQGSMMLNIALKDYFALHQNYLDRMVAAYVIGWSVTEKDLSEHPYLKFAEGSDDIGVIVSWNTEGPDNDNSILVRDGAVAINPLNWSRGDDYVAAENNKGSRVIGEDGSLSVELPGYGDAQIDAERGTLITTETRDAYFDSVEALGVKEQIFGARSLHSADYDLWFVNLQENIIERSEAWIAKHYS